MNETGTVLLGEGVGYEFNRQTNCVSVLTVKRQSGHNRRYTCQVVDERNIVQVEAHYTPVFTEGTIDDQSEKSNTGKIMFSLPDTLLGLKCQKENFDKILKRSHAQVGNDMTGQKNQTRARKINNCTKTVFH